MAASIENRVTVTESGNGPYAQFVTAGHLLEIAGKCLVSQTLKRPSIITSSLTPPLRSPAPAGD
jgi:hypothetical protein